jgi:glycosyltransferase involved in cell wall biosynthesis
MIKLLYIGDYSNSGFGTVAKGLLRNLAKTGKYEITQLGINYHDIDSFNEPWKIVPAGFSQLVGDQLYSTDPYGIKRLPYFLHQFDPDIVLVNNDFNIARGYMVDSKGAEQALSKHRSFKVLYAPVDSEPISSTKVEIAKMYDLVIAYSDWQRFLMSEHDEMFAMMPVLYHGVDTNVYKPMDKAEAKRALVEVLVEKNEGKNREEFESRILDKYIVYFVGTNQWRKDLPCLFRAFSIFQDQVDNSMLIPHTDSLPHDDTGWSLPNLQMLTGVERAILMKRAGIFSEAEMNIFYNAADVLAYPTRGEGFGLPSLEAMAVKTPVIATNFGPQQELHKNGRGYFIEALDVTPGRKFADSYFVLPDHRSLAKQLKFVHDNPDHVAETVERGYEFAKDMTWEQKAAQLDKILSKVPINGNELQADNTDQVNNQNA